jgi:hypothetical protein
MRYTRSAKESSSCPIKLLFFLHRATLPSMKSKNNPKGMNANAAQRFACADGGPRQYLIEEKIDITPQKPEVSISFGDRAALGRCGTIQFSDKISQVEHFNHGKMGVIVREQLLLFVNSFKRSDTALSSSYERYIPGSPIVDSFAEPFEAVALVRLDILLCCSTGGISAQ